MAEYYPLLAKAVASLPNSTPDTRRVLYERARKALLGQLRNLQPAIADEDIARESDALDAAVARLEAECADAAPPPLAPAVSAETPSGDVPAPNAPVAASPAAEAPASNVPPVIAVPQPSSEGGPAVAPAAPRLPPLLAPRPRVPRPPPVIPARPVPRMPPAPATMSPTSADPAAQSVATLAPPADVPPVPPPPTSPPDVPAAMPAGLAAASGADDAPPLQVRPEQQRPFAPQPPRPATPQRRTWIVAAVVGLIVVVVAFAAFKLRDRPEDLARMKAAVPVSDTAAGGKIADRVGGAAVTGAAPSVTPAPVASEPAQTAASAAAPAPAPATQQAAPTLGVAQRAALLVEAPDEPGKVKTYLGTVVWKLDNVSNGPGQPLTTAVRADVDIPDDKMQVSLVFQKNLDPSLPASHTIKIRFTVAADAPSGSVRQISVPQMRRDDTPSGDGLSGIPVPITDNVFLVGLTRGPQEESNIDLLRSRSWLDLPLLLSSGRIAKLTIEKSTSGQRAFDDAIASWQQPSQ